MSKKRGGEDGRAARYFACFASGSVKLTVSRVMTLCVGSASSNNTLCGPGGRPTTITVSPPASTKCNGASSTVLCASPSYLAARGCPTDPDDLGSHDCITVDSVAAPRSWKFIKAAREIAAPIRSRLTVSDSEAAISGAGITRVMLRAFLNWVIPRLKGRLA